MAKRRKKPSPSATEPGVTITIGPIPMSSILRATTSFYEDSDEIATIIRQIKVQFDGVTAPAAARTGKIDAEFDPPLRPRRGRKTRAPKRPKGTP